MCGGQKQQHRLQQDTSPIPAKLQTMSFVNQLKTAFTEIRNSFSLPNIIKLHLQGELMSQYIWSLLQLSFQQDKQNNPRPPEPSWSERAQRQVWALDTEHLACSPSLATCQVTMQGASYTLPLYFICRNEHNTVSKLRGLL